jgi:hypothetical protein
MIALRCAAVQILVFLPTSSTSESDPKTILVTEASQAMARTRSTGRI